MIIPNNPRSQHSSIIGPLPQIWCGTADRDGDADPWLSAPIGSIYVYLDQTNGQAYAYFKDNNNGADADWDAWNTP